MSLQNKNVVWLSVLVIIFSFFSATYSQETTQDSLKIIKAKGKYLLLKGYIVQEDTLIARTADAEKQVAKFLAEFEGALDVIDLLKEEKDMRAEKIELLKNIIKRKDYIIGQQDSLIIQLEKIAKPPHPIVRFLRKVFKPEVTLMLGFIGGVYAGIQVD